MAVQRFDAALQVFLDRYMRNVHTNIRGTVVGVNYGVPSVDVSIEAHTDFEDGTTDSYPTIYDVPLQLPSGNGGKARLSMPVKVGDKVGLSFSERNESDNTDVTTHTLFPAFAITEIFSDGNAKPIDPNNVVLENDKVKVEMTPEGDLTITTPKGKLNMDKDGLFSFGNGVGAATVTPSGQITFGNPNGGVTISADGESKFNGGTITKDGNFITAQGVNLNDFYQRFLTHVHSGVQTGGGQTGPIV